MNGPNRGGRDTPEYLRYNSLLCLMSPILLVFAIGKDLRRIGLRFLSQRFGKLHLKDGPGHRVWFHAASVGETAAAAPIIAELLCIRPDIRILFSNITATGYETALRLIPDAEHVYFPYDFPPFIRRALKAARPAVCITVESELWPNFIYLSRKAGACVAVVNGRISDRSSRRASAPVIRSVYQWMLAGLDGYYAQTDADAERAISLGASAHRVEVAGNSKFDGALVDDPPPESVAADMGFSAGGHTLVAGSTHPGEDEAVLDAFVLIRAKVPDARLIIAPRHLERVAVLKQLLENRRLQATFRSERRQAGAPSESAGGESDYPVLVLDTLGELRRTYSLAEVAFVGGTLVPIGGHDLLQPLAKGKPVLFGPHTHKCREIAGAVLENHAGWQVSGADDLARECVHLMQHAAVAEGAGAEGLALIQKSQGASRRYAERIAHLLPASVGGM